MPIQRPDIRKSDKPGEKRQRVDSSTSSNSNSVNLTTPSKTPSKTEGKAKSDLEQLQNVLENISKSEENTRKAVEIILSKQSFKCLIAESLMSKVNEVDKKVADLEQRMQERIDEIEQYSRRNCLKFCGIPESNGEDCDKIVLNIVNKLILTDETRKLTPEDIDRTHRVGRPQRGTITTKGTRDIIVKFISYRDRARIFAGKRNLKTFNANKDNEYRIFVNEALTKRRSDILFAARKLVKERKLDSVWTHDGRIIAKSKNGSIWNVNRVADLDRLNGNSPTPMSASGLDVFAEEFSPSVSSTPATSSAK